MFIAVLFIIAKRWEQPRCPLIDECINKMYVHAMDCYSAIKGKKKVLIHATAWLNLKNTVLGERSQSQKITYCVIPII